VTYGPKNKVLTKEKYDEREAKKKIEYDDIEEKEETEEEKLMKAKKQVSELTTLIVY